MYTPFTALLARCTFIRLSSHEPPSQRATRFNRLKRSPQPSLALFVELNLQLQLPRRILGQRFQRSFNSLGPGSANLSTESLLGAPGPQLGVEDDCSLEVRGGGASGVIHTLAVDDSEVIWLFFKKVDRVVYAELAEPITDLCSWGFTYGLCICCFSFSCVG